MLRCGVCCGTSQQAPDFTGVLPSVSYAPFEGTGHPDVDNIPSVEKIRADMKKLAPLTRAIRLYSSTGGVELVPPIAAEFGIKVTVGAWIDKNSERNEREIAAAIDLARHNSNVIGVVVGNETVYRGEQKVDDLIELIKQVKKSVNVPVTTGEIWNIWRDNPQLGYSVDFIAAHVLPYWENFTADQAVDQAVAMYQLLRDQFPGKRIVIAEFGWPSAGYNLRNAEPGPFEQAAVLRNFVSRAEAIGMEYNIVEAIDQPWKYFRGRRRPLLGHPECRAGAEIFLDRADRQSGLLEARRHRPSRRHPDVAADPAAGPAHRDAGAAVVGGGQRRRRLGRDRVRLLGRPLLRVRLGLRADAGIDPAGAAGPDRDGPDRGNRRDRLRTAAAPAAGQGAPRAATIGEGVTFPKVSIHVPAYFEPPEMLKQTLDALSRLDYPNFECVVIINNTPDPAFWQPIQDHCRALGERFKFINAEKVEGFKAGALRIAMERTAVDAEIIGIIDADYVVEPDWLKDLVPVFADPRVGLVQAPQDHRDGDLSLMHYIMNGEYAGFFDIGMVQRNEENAIIVHGTMCLIRRAAMDIVRSNRSTVLISFSQGVSL